VLDLLQCSLKLVKLTLQIYPPLFPANIKRLTRLAQLHRPLMNSATQRDNLNDLRRRVRGDCPLTWKSRLFQALHFRDTTGACQKHAPEP
jgi:hypothetical protein